MTCVGRKSYTFVAEGTCIVEIVSTAAQQYATRDDLLLLLCCSARNSPSDSSPNRSHTLRLAAESEPPINKSSLVRQNAIAGTQCDLQHFIPVAQREKPRRWVHRLPVIEENSKQQFAISAFFSYFSPLPVPPKNVALATRIGEKVQTPRGVSSGQRENGREDAEWRVRDKHAEQLSNSYSPTKHHPCAEEKIVLGGRGGGGARSPVSNFDGKKGRIIIIER